MLTNNSNNGANPGVGLKLTAPRNHAHDVHKANPGPGSYQIPGGTDLTERERLQNEITSKRYGSPSSSNNGSMLQPPKASSFPSSAPSPHSVSSGQKRQRVDQDSPSVPGMGDQTDRQLHQNGITSKRYHSASGDTHHSK